MNLKSIWKTGILVGSLVEVQIRFLFLWLTHSRALTIRERATWLHQSCSRITRRLGIVLDVDGEFPGRGMVVSNHLSHLDILLYGALGPVVFVAKSDVRSWPLLGWLARRGGTVFVDRASKAQAAEAARQMEELLRGDLPVVLFPEGTSSDGVVVLPFRSSLFEAAVRAECGVTAAAIGYSAEGMDESALAYFGEKVFFPHLVSVLGCDGLAVRIGFAREAEMFADRKVAALVMHGLVSGIRSALGLAQQSWDSTSFVASSSPVLLP